VRRSRLLFAITLVATDAAMSMLAFFLAYLVRRWRVGPELGPFVDYLPLALIQTATIILTFFLFKFYHRRHAALLPDEVYRIFGAVSVATLITIAFVSFVLRDALQYQRSMLVMAWAFGLFFLGFGRWLHSRVQRKLQARGLGAEKVLIVGTGEVGRMVLQKIQQSPGLGYQVAGFVEANGDAAAHRAMAGVRQSLATALDRGAAEAVAGAPEGGTEGMAAAGAPDLSRFPYGSVLGIPILGHVEDLPRLISSDGIGEVIIALPEATHQELVGIVSQCEREKVSIRVFPDVFQIMASEVTISDLGGLPLLTIRDVALRGWKLTLKRIVDVGFSGLFLLIFSPVMMMTALAIRLDSPGPVFFVQERMGLDARPFRMLKFRSMRSDAEAMGTWTTKDDPRRTRVGTLIRKYSIDELPQFINVLMGDMSVVGPRPEQPAYVEQFQSSIPRYMERHREKAGVTGWAQVNGLRGDTSISERTKYDLWYTENWSLWLDFKIILRTAFQAVADKNAY
jgi:Undecaprenyl-phosphate glucose phosphotransferase